VFIINDKKTKTSPADHKIFKKCPSFITAYCLPTPILKNHWQKKMINIRLRLLLPVISFTSLMVVGCSSSKKLSEYSSSNYFKNSNVGSLVNTPNLPDTVSTFGDRDIIRAGDQLQISVWGYPEFNTTTTVKDYGTVTIPLIGDIMAAGLTTSRFTSEISKRLTEYVKSNPNVTVSHIDMNRRISVVGAVNKQDNYTSLSEVTLVEIIAAAGGPAPDADLAHVKIFRSGKATDAIDVDLAAHLEQGDMEDLPKVKSGDTVFIPREENAVRDLSGFLRDILLLFGFFFVL
jgi:polysaccharide export outer membrane protein